MSTQPPVAPQPDLQEIKIVSHSNLFYWWPVWAVGFILSILTWIDGHRVALVPPDTHAYRNAKVEIQEAGQRTILENRDVLVVPQGKHLNPPPPKEQPDQPQILVAASKGYGVLYAFVLLLVIIITNVPLRGLWSFIVILLIVFAVVIFTIMEWWGPILDSLGRLHIYMNFAGYFLVSLALFIVWLITFVLFDPQIYMVFSPGQLKVRQEIGGGEVAHDTMGMVVQKQRNDLFRHWILGLGSGDLIVNTSGARAQHFDLPNVLFVGYKVRQIEEMLREKPIVQG